MLPVLSRLYKKSYNILFSGAIILLYHRIANVKDDPHLLSVSPENFQSQLIYLKKHYNVIGLRDLVRQNKEKKLKSLIITFDDGYVDNFYKALPIIERFRVPITIFVTAGKISDKRPFYWDEQTSPTDQGRPLTADELVSLSKSQFVEIGSHTMSHPRLVDLSKKNQTWEIQESRKVLERIIGKKIFGFSYPFGGRFDYGQETIALVKDSGYEYACSNFPSRVTDRSKMFELPRYLVRNWDIKEFSRNLERFL